VLYDTWLIAYVALRVRGLVVAERALAVGGGDTAESGREFGGVERPTVTVLVAARNELEALPQTLDALLAQLDPPEQIIVIDDGSTDATAAMLSRRYGAVTVLRKARSGKADSLNQALGLALGHLVVTLDADTHLEPGALTAIRRAFSHELQLAAVGGVLSPHCAAGRTGQFFQWFQTFEYVRAFLSRVAWMRVDALLLVSGAFAAYRRDVLQALEGFDASSLVEDYEIIHRLHQHAAEHGLDWRVRVLHAAHARTDAPGTLPAFLRQRRRWFAGFLQTQYRHRFMTGNVRYGSVGRFMMPIKVIDTLQPIYGLTAFVLLLGFLVGGRSVLWSVLWVIGAKLLIDFCFQLWGVHLYYRWLNRPPRGRDWVLAALASLAEPFSFQIMRHTGALLGWWAVLTGRMDWAPRGAVAPTGKH